MLGGYNTNVRHRGVMFHVQTEDSGRQNPHIITHVYHGGTILASEKLDYTDQVKSADLPAVVRQLMERQHKALLQQLRRGDLDATIAERLGLGVFSEGSQTRPPAPLRKPPSSLPPPGGAARGFGEGLISDRPLDEVVLDYLVENARKRKRQHQNRKK